MQASVCPPCRVVAPRHSGEAAAEAAVPLALTPDCFFFHVHPHGNIVVQRASSTSSPFVLLETPSRRTGTARKAAHSLARSQPPRNNHRPPTARTVDAARRTSSTPRESEDVVLAPVGYSGGAVGCTGTSYLHRQPKTANRDSASRPSRVDQLESLIRSHQSWVGHILEHTRPHYS